MDARLREWKFIRKSGKRESKPRLFGLGHTRGPGPGFYPLNGYFAASLFVIRDFVRLALFTL